MAIRGRSKRLIQKKSERSKDVFRADNIPLGPLVPLQKGSKNKETLFKMHYDIKQNIKNNFANLIMTRKGEKFCDLDYGVDFKNLYTLMHSEEQEALNTAGREINEAISKFIPKINIVEIYTSSSDNSNQQKAKENEKAKNLYNSQNIQILQSKALNQENTYVNEDAEFKLHFSYVIPLLGNDLESLSFTLKLKTSS